MKKLFNEKGVIHILPLLVVIAAVGIISFLMISSTAPIGGLFGKLNPKPASHAATTSSGCQFLSSPGASAAFCDDLSGGTSPGGRAGDLDDKKWSVGRFVGQFQNNNLMPFPQVPTTPCKAGVTQVNSDDDILVCDSASGHLGQFQTAMAAQFYALVSLRPRQQFDFSGRTGTITYNVDAATQSPLGWWTSLYVTEDPVDGANNTTRVSGMTPRNGVGINFDGNNCAGAIGTSLKVNDVFVYNDYGETDVPVGNGICIQTKAGFQNHFEIRLSQTNIEVWASDFSTDGSLTFPNFRMVGSTAINLNFSKGYVHFQHGQRAPTKYAASGGFTGLYSNYYWSNLGFDGPVAGLETGYAVADALTHNPNTIDEFPNHSNNLNIGYGLLNLPNSTFTCCTNGSRVTIAPFSLPNVNLTGVTSAELTFSIFFSGGSFNSSTYVVKYRFNGGAWKNPNPTPEFAKALYCAAWCSNPPFPSDANWSMGFSFPVAVTDLVQGANTLEIAADEINTGNPPILANIDLLTFGGAVVSTPLPLPSSTPIMCPKGLLGDIDCDGKIGIFDYNLLIGNFGKTGTGIQGDLDSDGKVGIFDYNILIGNFGK